MHHRAFICLVAQKYDCRVQKLQQLGNALLSTKPVAFENRLSPGYLGVDLMPCVVDSGWKKEKERQD